MSIVLLAKALPCCATTAAVWSATVLAGASWTWAVNVIPFYNYCTVVVRGSSTAKKHHQQPLKLHAVGEDPLLLNLASHAFPTRCWVWKDVRSARGPGLLISICVVAPLWSNQYVIAESSNDYNFASGPQALWTVKQLTWLKKLELSFFMMQGSIFVIPLVQDDDRCRGFSPLHFIATVVSMGKSAIGNRWSIFLDLSRKQQRPFLPLQLQRWNLWKVRFEESITAPRNFSKVQAWSRHMSRPCFHLRADPMAHASAKRPIVQSHFELLSNLFAGNHEPFQNFLCQNKDENSNPTWDPYRSFHYRSMALILHCPDHRPHPSPDVSHGPGVSHQSLVLLLLALPSCSAASGASGTALDGTLWAKPACPGIVAQCVSFRLQLPTTNLNPISGCQPFTW